MINNLYIKATPTTASVTWGDITGTLSDQTDLQSALDAKFDEPTGTVSEYLRGDGSLATFPSLTGYVPYTGATADVDLGTHTLSAKDLVINHSSGSGVAASITKGGAGEALTVNKTSGSGNAMSVTGGVTQLSELHLTTDLADAYIASAATWNAKVSDTRTISTTAPLSGGGDLSANRTLSITQANTSTNGFLSSTDWNTFNGKQDTLVSGTNIKTLEGQSLLGSGNIDLTKSDVGLGNVDNTSDLNKPISTATQTALNAKQNTLTLTTTGTSGAATLVGSTLNIPQYGGGGSSYPVKLASSFSGTQITGQTLTISDSLYIPANTITQTNFLLQINATLYRTFSGAGGGVLGWLYLNTTNSLTGATLIGRSAQISSGQQWSGFNRNFPVRTSTAYGLGTGNQFGLDYTSNSGFTFTFNKTQNNYLIFAISSVNVNDGGTWINSKADLYV
jgi:hypothetical protein